MIPFFEKNKDYLYVGFRVLLGFMLMLHGASKIGLMGETTPAGFAGFAGIPVWLGWLVAIGEFGGGIGILLGVFTRFSAFWGIVIMLGAYFMRHMPEDWTLVSGGGEMALMYVAGLLVLLGYGAGKLSLEKAIFKKEFF